MSFRINLAMINPV